MSESELAEIRGILNEQTRALGRLESGQIETRSGITDLKEMHGTLETRIRRVENRTYWYAGAAAVISFIAAKLGINIPIR